MGWLVTSSWWSTTLAPHEALYEVSLLSYIHIYLQAGTTQNQAEEEAWQTRDQIFAILKHNLVAAHERMKHQYNKHKTERQSEPFQVQSLDCSLAFYTRIIKTPNRIEFWPRLLQLVNSPTTPDRDCS
jgi:hypothetical protein